MGAAFGWGLLAASSLVIGAVIALLFRDPRPRDRAGHGVRRGRAHQRGRVRPRGGGVRHVTRRGAGHRGPLRRRPAAFAGGDWLIGRVGGGDRKDASGAQENGSSLAIVLGTVLDGIPESMVIGLTIFQGGEVGAAYLVVVFISNLPESGLLDGWPRPAGAGRGRGPLGWGSRPRAGLGPRLARGLRPLPGLLSQVYRRLPRPGLRGGRDP